MFTLQVSYTGGLNPVTDRRIRAASPTLRAVEGYEPNCGRRSMFFDFPTPAEAAEAFAHIKGALASRWRMITPRAAVAGNLRVEAYESMRGSATRKRATRVRGSFVE
jgi:hypothetical protein